MPPLVEVGKPQDANDCTNFAENPRGNYNMINA